MLAPYMAPPYWHLPGLSDLDGLLLGPQIKSTHPVLHHANAHPVFILEVMVDFRAFAKIFWVTRKQRRSTHLFFWRTSFGNAEGTQQAQYLMYLLPRSARSYTCTTWMLSELNLFPQKYKVE